jgi:hypothetical protein
LQLVRPSLISPSEAVFVDQTVKIIAPQQTASVNENIPKKHGSPTVPIALLKHHSKNI